MNDPATDYPLDQRTEHPNETQPERHNMTSIEATTLSVNGVDYVRADTIPNQSPAASLDGLPYVLVRSGQAGVFAGYLVWRDEDTVELRESRRIYYWAGAATLSQLALDGTSKPDSCKFPAALPAHTVLRVCEVIPVSEKARLSIAAVKVWEQ